jgi:hypothetical protein
MRGRVQMLTCTKGKITKTASGKIKLLIYGHEAASMDVKDKSNTETWDNCKCPDGEKYVEIKCISAQNTEKNQPMKGKVDISGGFQIEYDLTVDSTRDVTNCEYECKQPD